MFHEGAYGRLSLSSPLRRSCNLHDLLGEGSVPPSRKLLVAIAAGVALAAPPVAGFNLWLNHLVEQQGQEELDVTAGRSIGLAEVRASQALEMLDTLAARGVDSCRPEHIEALRQATFATTPVKEHSIIAPDGRTLCSDVGSSLEARKVVSSELIAPDSDLLIEVIRVGDRPDPLVRLRRPGSGNGNGLAALIPSNLFVARVSQRRGPSTGHIHVDAGRHDDHRIGHAARSCQKRGSRHRQTRFDALRA